MKAAERASQSRTSINAQIRQQSTLFWKVVGTVEMPLGEVSVS